MEGDLQFADMLGILWKRREELERAGIEPVLVDLELAGTLVDMALNVEEPVSRSKVAARAAHAVDAVIEHVCALPLAEPLKKAVQIAVSELRARLAGTT